MIIPNKWLIIFGLPAFLSCNESSGKIEVRSNEKIYIVNTSRSKSYDFTVKETKTNYDSTSETSTSVLFLSPGEEKLLGHMYENRDVLIMQSDSIKSIYKDLSEEYDLGEYHDFLGKVKIPAKRRILFDSALKRLGIIDFQRFENWVYGTIGLEDPGKRSTYKYEITGQASPPSQ